MEWLYRDKSEQVASFGQATNLIIIAGGVSCIRGSRGAKMQMRELQ